MKNILLTRAFEDNQLVQRKLEYRDFICYQMPLIEYIDSFDAESMDAALCSGNYNNIIITSKYAAKLICYAENISSIYTKNFWVVGYASANMLRSNGCQVKEIADTASKLIQKLPRNILSDTIYLSGDQITMQMPTSVKRIIIYKVKYKDSLSDDDVIAIKNGMNYVTLYSENSARTLYSLLNQNNLLEYIKNSVLIAISDKVANIMNSHFKHQITMNNSDDLINILYQYEQESAK